jgi:nitroimidazol reductase NimA-like FMN-containing flavoprotein (pyridoxamine 5'-phosphate oxidase superfamily)
MKEEQRTLFRQLCTKQRFAVIATQNGTEPYTSLVAFSATKDFSHLIFATLRQTRKFTNIIKNPKISMLIDNRENLSSDVKNTIAITVLGTAYEIKDNTQHFMDIHLKKHPYLTKFVQNPNCALIGLSVKKFYMVQQFQQVKIPNRMHTR